MFELFPFGPKGGISLHTRKKIEWWYNDGSDRCGDDGNDDGNLWMHVDIDHLKWYLAVGQLYMSTYRAGMKQVLTTGQELPYESSF